VSRPVHPRTVDSAQNPRVKEARALERDRSLRDSEGAFIAWGRHLAQEALRRRARVRRAFVTADLAATREGSDILRDLEAASVPLLHASRRVLESIAAGSGDQGVLLIVDRPAGDARAVLGPGSTLVMALHGVQDPGNVGSILRTSLALGASGLVALPGCADPFGSRAVRAGMGAQFSLPVAAVEARDFLAHVERGGIQLVAADPSARDNPPDVDLLPPTVLLLGSEAAGLPLELRRAARFSIRIPMARGVDSLNVHAAAAALLYEASRQRGFRGGS